jgi:hypothetical protein
MTSAPFDLTTPLLHTPAGAAAPPAPYNTADLEMKAAGAAESAAQREKTLPVASIAAEPQPEPGAAAPALQDPALHASPPAGDTAAHRAPLKRLAHALAHLSGGAAAPPAARGRVTSEAVAAPATPGARPAVEAAAVPADATAFSAAAALAAAPESPRAPRRASIDRRVETEAVFKDKLAALAGPPAAEEGAAGSEASEASLAGSREAGVRLWQDAPPPRARLQSLRERLGVPQQASAGSAAAHAAREAQLAEAPGSPVELSAEWREPGPERAPERAGSGSRSEGEVREPPPSPTASSAAYAAAASAASTRGSEAVPEMRAEEEAEATAAAGAAESEAAPAAAVACASSMVAPHGALFDASELEGAEGAEGEGAEGEGAEGEGSDETAGEAAGKMEMETEAAAAKERVTAPQAAELTSAALEPLEPLAARADSFTPPLFDAGAAAAAEPLLLPFAVVGDGAGCEGAAARLVELLHLTLSWAVTFSVVAALGVGALGTLAELGWWSASHLCLSWYTPALLSSALLATVVVHLGAWALPPGAGSRLATAARRLAARASLRSRGERAAAVEVAAALATTGVVEEAALVFELPEVRTEYEGARAEAEAEERAELEVEAIAAI